MATITLGTNATNSLNGLKFVRQYSTPAGIAGLATVNANILDDLNVAHPTWPGAFRSGFLHIPNRGVLQVLPGDYVAYDSTGWPILVSSNAIANGPWTHT